MRDRVRSVKVEGYLSIRSAEVPLTDINLLIGANGSGKSNFVSALEMLGRIVDGDLQIYVGRRGGASRLLYRGSANSESIVLDVDFPPGGYKAELVSAAGDTLVFADEMIRHDLSPTEREGWNGWLGRGHRETRLFDGDTGSTEASAQVADVLRGCRVFHVHDTSADSPVKRRADTANDLHLAADAGNLAPFLRRLYDLHPADYRRIVSTVQQVAPFFKDFVLEADRAGMLLRWKQIGVDGEFGADALSDGTLRFMCLATLLLQPDPPPLIVLDEPELGLHPAAVTALAGMLRSATARCQVVAATQSVSLVSQFAIEDLVVVDRTRDGSHFRRLRDADFESWLDEYSTGELWEKNILGGRPAMGVE